MPARILIIEDDPASLELARYLLGASGHETFAAVNGEMGARMALETEPDIILCDLQMPLLNGFEVLARLRGETDWRQVPLIAVSALSMMGDAARAFGAGFDGYLTKPIAPETFVAEIEAFLAQGLPSGRQGSKPDAA